jgi:hypothetical protein
MSLRRSDGVKDAAALLAAAVADESDNEEQTSAKKAAGTPRDFESAAEGARRKSPYVSAGSSDGSDVDNYEESFEESSSADEE